MLFETAGVEVSPWLPPLVAFVISFFTSMGGVSGAFLLLPFQMSFLGYTNPSVSATNQLFNVVAIPSGVYRYWKEGRMVAPLVWVVVAGTLPGVLIGALVRVLYLPDPRSFKLFAAFVLAGIGLKMLHDLMQKKGAAAPAATKRGESMAAVEAVRFDLKRISYSFAGSSYQAPTWAIFSLSLVVGVIGGIYGIGGGAIIAPFFVTVLGLPVHTVAGAALMGTFITSVAGVAFYQLIAPFFPGMSVAPDWLLGLLFGLGGMAGIYLGARCQKYVPARAIKLMLAAVILFTATKYALQFWS